MASLAIDGRLDVGATRASHEPHSSTKPDGLSGSLSGHHAGCRDSLALYLDQVRNGFGIISFIFPGSLWPPPRPTQPRVCPSG